jgi:hypothetical protein
MPIFIYSFIKSLFFPPFHSFPLSHERGKGRKGGIGRDENRLYSGVYLLLVFNESKVSSPLVTQLLGRLFYVRLLSLSAVELRTFNQQNVESINRGVQAIIGGSLSSFYSFESSSGDSSEVRGGVEVNQVKRLYINPFPLFFLINNGRGLVKPFNF